MATVSVLKAGYLYRRSKYLHKWKRNCFSLMNNGELRYFEDSNATVASDTIVMDRDCDFIMGSDQCTFSPPDDMTINCCFEIVLKNGDSWKLCADSSDEKLAWILTLQDMRDMRRPIQRPIQRPPPYAPPGAPYYQHYPYYQVNPNQPLYTVQGPGGVVHYAYPPPGQTVVVYDNHHRCCDSGLGTGMLAGAAIGSMMMTPWLMAPLFWC